MSYTREEWAEIANKLQGTLNRTLDERDLLLTACKAHRIVLDHRAGCRWCRAMGANAVLCVNRLRLYHEAMRLTIVAIDKVKEG